MIIYHYTLKQIWPRWSVIFVVNVFFKIIYTYMSDISAATSTSAWASWIFTIHARWATTMARRGEVKMSRGVVQTPNFMPIGTQWAIKWLSMEDMHALGAEIILGNTYHLRIKGRKELIKRAGWLHAFNTRDKPILTDSWGFQVFSLWDLRKVEEEGVTFREQKSGKKYFLSPEESMRIQTVLWSDVALILDHVLAAQPTKAQTRDSVRRTDRWMHRAVAERERLHPWYVKDGSMPMLWGIPQGMHYPEIREAHAHSIQAFDFPGYSIWGIASNTNTEETTLMEVRTQTQILEDHKPRHLLWVGTPRELVQCVAAGIDLFDCVYPTRNARHGSIFLEIDDDHYESVRIVSKRFEFDFSPICEDSVVPELRTYSKAYLRHLIRSKELLGQRLATLQNLDFYYRLMRRMRTKIENGSFDAWYMKYKRVVR